MPVPSSTTSLGVALSSIQSYASQAKGQAQSALNTLQTTNVTSQWVFSLLDQLGGFIGALNNWLATPGFSAINAYATANIPNYAGTLTTDMQTCVTNATACITWVVNNFPKDSTNTWLEAFSLNADGTRTSRTFTPAQTAGLQSALTTLINSIG